MQTRDVKSVAVDDRGLVLCSDGARIARIEDGRLVDHAPLPPRTIVASMAARPGGGTLVVDAHAHRLLEVDAGGHVEPFAGRPQPPSLDRRAIRRDGPAAEALFRAPHVVAAGTTSSFYRTPAGLAVGTSVREAAPGEGCRRAASGLWLRTAPSRRSVLAELVVVRPGLRPACTAR